MFMAPPLSMNIYWWIHTCTRICMGMGMLSSTNPLMKRNMFIPSLQVSETAIYAATVGNYEQQATCKHNMQPNSHSDEYHSQSMTYDTPIPSPNRSRRRWISLRLWLGCQREHCSHPWMWDSFLCNAQKWELRELLRCGDDNCKCRTSQNSQHVVSFKDEYKLQYTRESHPAVRKEWKSGECQIIHVSENEAPSGWAWTWSPASHIPPPNVKFIFPGPCVMQKGLSQISVEANLRHFQTVSHPETNRKQGHRWSNAVILERISGFDYTRAQPSTCTSKLKWNPPLGV